MPLLTLKSGVVIPPEDLVVEVYTPTDPQFRNGIKIKHSKSDCSTSCHSNKSQYNNRTMALARMELLLNKISWKPSVVQSYDLNPFPHGQL